MRHAGDLGEMIAMGKQESGQLCGDEEMYLWMFDGVL
jgi:hypothetical protein